MEVDVVPFDVCGVILGSPYLYVRDAIFRRRANQYWLVKDGKEFTISAHKDKAKLSLISDHHARRIIGSTKKLILLFLKQRKQQGEGSEVGLISCYGTSCMDKESISTYYAKGTIIRVLNRTKDGYWNGQVILDLDL